MASFRYLYKNRVKFPFFSYQFFKVWAKRFLLIHIIIKKNILKAVLNFRGAKIDELAEIGNPQFDGKLSNLRIGANSYVGDVFLALHEKITINKYVCINNGVKILTATHDVEDSNWSLIKNEVNIDDYVWIGMNAIILPGVRIEKGAVIGAGSVVTKSVPSGCIVAGNPAKILFKKRRSVLKYNPCEFLAANRAWLIG